MSKQFCGVGYIYLFLVWFCLTPSVSFSVTETIEVDPEVRKIISEKCADCHSEKLVPLRVLKYENYLGGCGGCHVPFSDGHYLSGCTDCHDRPEKSHFNLRDSDNQTRLKPDAEDECIACHFGGTHQLGKGFPPLTSDEEIITYARTGTLRSWIQPGGFMAKYVTDDETAAISNWIDRISADRTLDYDPYLNATKIQQDFDIREERANPAWLRATPHFVNLGLTPVTPLTDVQPTPQTARVRLKALYSNDYLYIRAEYRDQVLDMTGVDSWVYDPTTGLWEHPQTQKVYAEVYPDAEVYVKQSEDRFAFIWNKSIPEYKAMYGCALKCHGNIPGSSCFTDQQNTEADVWIVEAASGMGAIESVQSGLFSVARSENSHGVTRGRVAFQGFADDKRLVWFMDIDDGYNTESAGMVGDNGTGVYEYNRSAGGSTPRYLEADVENYIDAMVLNQEEIEAGEVLIADPDDPQYAGDLAVATAWSNYRGVNAVVPEKIITTPGGSRGDVMHTATWRNGVWTHMFKRKLVTENADDIQFDPSQEYEYSLTVFDNCGWGEIPPMHNMYGDGQYQVLRFRK